MRPRVSGYHRRGRSDGVLAQEEHGKPNMHASTTGNEGYNKGAVSTPLPHAYHGLDRSTISIGLSIHLFAAALAGSRFISGLFILACSTQFSSPLSRCFSFAPVVDSNVHSEPLRLGPACPIGLSSPSRVNGDKFEFFVFAFVTASLPSRVSSLLRSRSRDAEE